MQNNLTVVLLCHDRPNSAIEAVRSILRQTDSNFDFENVNVDTDAIIEDVNETMEDVNETMVGIEEIESKQHVRLEMNINYEIEH